MTDTQPEKPILKPETEAVCCPNCNEVIAFKRIPAEPTAIIVNPEIKEIIINTVLEHYEQTWEEINVLSRKREYVITRQVIQYFLKMKTDMSLKKIGMVFNRDHSTAIHAIQTVTDIMISELKFRNKIEALEKLIDFRIKQL